MRLAPTGWLDQKHAAMRPRLLTATLCLLSLCLLANRSDAQVIAFTWTGNSTNNGAVTDGTNWGGIAPLGVGGLENLIFAASGAQTNVLFPTFNSANLSFGSSRPAYTVSGSGVTPVLTLSAASGVSVTAGSTVTFDNTLGLNLATGVLSGDDHTFNIAAATTLQINGVISGGGHLSKTGTGTLVLTGTNTYNYTGGLGFLDSTSIHFGTVHLDGGSINHTGTGDVQISLNASDNATLLIDNGGHINDYFGVLAQGIGSTATATVSGSTSYWTNSSGLDVGYSGTGTLNILNGADVTVSDIYSIIGWGGSANGTVKVDGAGSTWINAGPLTLGGAGTAAMTVSNGGLVSFGGGANPINIATSSTGNGTLNIGATAAGPAAAGGVINASAITTVLGAGTVQFNTTATSGSPYYLTKDGTSGGTAVIISGTTQVINTAGYNVLAGTNTYTGTTTIAGGTLVAGNNSAFGTSAVTLNGGTLNVANGVNFGNTLGIGINGGTLAGNGTFTSPLTLGAGVTLAPGNSPGTLNFASGLTLNDGGTLEIEIQAPTGTPGTNWDLLDVTGTLNLTGLSTGGYTLKAISLDLSGNPGAVSGLISPVSWNIAVGTTISGFQATDFVIDSSQFNGGGNFTLSLSGNNLLLNFTPVPEPSTYALMAAGIGLTGFCRWRRRR